MIYSICLNLFAMAILIWSFRIRRQSKQTLEDTKATLARLEGLMEKLCANKAYGRLYEQVEAERRETRQRLNAFWGKS